jgi:hypothetical protein
MRYDNHQAIDELIQARGEWMSVSMNSWESPSKKGGQDLIIKMTEIGELFPECGNFELAFNSEKGFLKSCQEIIPANRHFSNSSFLDCTWTWEIEKAIFTNSESIRMLNGKGLGAESVSLRLPYASGRDKGWAGSINQFPAQREIDRKAQTAEIKPIAIK